MSDRFFLDTNIFVCSLDHTVPAKRAKAARLVDEAIDSGKGVISFQVVQEFFSVVLRRFSKPMTPAEGEQYLALTFRPLLAVHSSYSLYAQALLMGSRYSLSWYDSLIVAAAVESGCGILYSEDLQHGQKFDKLQVQNPFL